MKNVYHHHMHRAKAGIKPERDRLTLFVHDTTDDEWMDFVASRKWIVFTQDYSLHREDATLAVIKQHGAKVFYLAGAENNKREIMKLFLNRHDQMVDFALMASGPFVIRVKPRGAFEEIDLNAP